MTISDVAARAGVSPATVSRVLNGLETVAPELRVRVQEAVDHLSYRAYGPARALRQQLTRVWMAVVADIENPFFTAVVRAAEDEAVDAGYQVVLCNSDEDLAKEAAYIEVAIGERVGGVIIAAASTEDSNVAALIAAGIPVVAIDRAPAQPQTDSVLVDNQLGGALATEHLLAAGAERIACITGPRGLSTAEERYAGFQQAIEGRMGSVDPNAVRHADFRTNGGYAAAASLLAGRHRYGPDALFVANNLMTLGAMRAIHDAGLRIPDDVLLVGFDDAPWSTVTQPALTVVAQPTHAIGTTAARLLSTARSADAPRHVVLEPSLIVRQSSTRDADPSAPAPARAPGHP